MADKTQKNWKDNLVYTKSNTVRSNSAKNAGVYITHHPDMGGLFRKNSFKFQVEVVRKPAWSSKTDIHFPRPLQENDVTAARYWLEANGVFVAQQVVYGAIEISAGYHEHDPLITYLDGLTWDGEKRLSGWMTTLLGTEPTEYSDMIGRKFLIGSVARALCPGCKMDTVLILEGAQGLRKSSFIEKLYGHEYYTDDVPAVGTKDASMQMRGHWVLEIPEMHALTKTEVANANLWITRRVDKYRPPYGRVPIEAPRRCVFVGSVNPASGYLRDPTGGRRFWPIVCGDINLDLTDEIRDQLWAEAVSAYRAGEPWWLITDAEVELAKDEQDERFESDPWENLILEYVDGKDVVTVQDVLRDVVKLDRKEWSRAVEMRIGRFLIRSGYDRTRLNLRGVRVWAYKRRRSPVALYTLDGFRD